VDEAIASYTMDPSSASKAIAHIRAQTLALQPEAARNLTHIFQMSNIATTETAPAVIRSTARLIAEHARIALHFHPDRPVHNPSISGPLPAPLKHDGTTPLPTGYLTTVSESLLHDGIYKSQFDTFISNGAVSAHPGGARDEWEAQLFGGAYHPTPPALPISASERPRYGALDLFRPADGPAPRFGSCYFILKPSVGRRATVTYGGSQDLPKWRGCLAPEMVDEGALDAILWQVFEDAFVREAVLGVRGIRPPQLMERLKGLNEPMSWEDAGEMLRNLDHMIEVQVHGEVRLDSDVELLVYDPSFRAKETGNDLLAMGERYGFPVRWHSGSVIRTVDVPCDFRGPSMPSLASRIAVDGVVDAEKIGAAVRDLAANPVRWADQGSYAEMLQEFKLLWHVLVKYGGPIDVSSGQP
jgi:hypothetical protein